MPCAPFSLSIEDTGHRRLPVFYPDVTNCHLFTQNVAEQKQVRGGKVASKEGVVERW